jgi:hypothetical protein
MIGNQKIDIGHDFLFSNYLKCAEAAPVERLVIYQFNKKRKQKWTVIRY